MPTRDRGSPSAPTWGQRSRHCPGSVSASSSLAPSSWPAASYSSSGRSEEGAMSSPTITVPAPRELAGLDEATDRYAGIKQYSFGQVVAVWAAAAIPMGVLAWIVAPAL